VLPLERTGEHLEAPPSFMVVVSYNPGYQNLMKALKPSTRQRFVSIEFDFLPRELEIATVSLESGLAEGKVAPLVDLAHRLRRLKGQDLEEGVSTRLLIYCATLIDAGLPLSEAVLAAIIEPMTDEPDVKAALQEIADSTLA
jgi:nitric oxide reductase NorQ protein